MWNTNRVVVQNLEIINFWGEEHVQKLPKSMIVDLHRKQIWALGTEVTLETIGESEAFKIDKHRTPRVIECFDNNTADTPKDKRAKDPEAITSVTGNISNEGSDSVMASNNMDDTMDPAVTREGKKEATTSGCTHLENLPDDKKPVEMKGSVNIDYANFELRSDKTLTPELEIWFSIDDLRIGIDKGEDDIHDIDAL